MNHKLGRGMKIKTILLFFLVISSIDCLAKLVEYELFIDHLMVNYTGKQKRAMAISGQIPAPTIQATVGDMLRVTFHNNMSVDTSIHWHGILLPNDQDGVPYLTTPPIKAHSSFTYEFPIIHSGTYWYHSHTGLQEQRGLYGALVFHPEYGEREKTNRDSVVVLSDWIDEQPDTVLSNLKRDGDYYMLKKGNVQSWLGVLRNGSKAIENRMQLSWQRMGTMDISDIGYDVFLANGKQQCFIDALPGESVRVRVVNSSAGTYYNLEFAGGPMKVVSLDGVDVNPFEVDRFLMAIAETYDVVVQVPDDGKAYELRASSEDGVGYSSIVIGKGDLVKAPTIPKPNLFLKKMHHSNHGKQKEVVGHKGYDTKKHHQEIEKSHVGHNQNDSSHVSYKDNYQNIKSVVPTNFDLNLPKREVVLRLTGNMDRYWWGINDRPLSEVDSILIKKGEVVQLDLVNETMMHHPMHLHGHFFRVLNNEDEYGPLKHTVNVPAMDQVSIEFLASEDQDWFFHCHNLYHMMSGLSRVISYKDSTNYTKAVRSRLAHDDQWFVFVDNSFLSNMMMGHCRYWNTRNAFEVEYDYNYKKEFEVDALYRRALSRYVDIYAGANIERDFCDTKITKLGVFGIEVVLPLWILADVRVDTDAHVYIEFRSSLHLTQRLFFEWQVNSDKDYRTTFSYEINKDWLLTLTHDSDFHFGGGIRFRFS